MKYGSSPSGNPAPASPPVRSAPEADPGQTSQHLQAAGHADFPVNHAAASECGAAAKVSAPEAAKSVVAAPRLFIDVPLGTPYCDIQESIFRQAWELAGSQLRAAIALGLLPDTVIQFLGRCNARRQAAAHGSNALPLLRSVPSAPNATPRDDRDGLRACFQKSVKLMEP